MADCIVQGKVCNDAIFDRPRGLWLCCQCHVSDANNSHHWVISYLTYLLCVFPIGFYLMSIFCRLSFMDREGGSWGWNRALHLQMKAGYNLNKSAVHRRAHIKRQTTIHAHRSY